MAYGHGTLHPVAINLLPLLFARLQWGWTGLQPGDWAELVLDTRADGKSVKVDQDGKKVKANIWLSYLRSYEVGPRRLGLLAAAAAGWCALVPGSQPGMSGPPRPAPHTCSTWASRAWSAAAAASATLAG